jgi:hypothetical protein
MKQETDVPLNLSRCAAELVYGRFLLGNELANKLASMAHSMDFFYKRSISHSDV